MAVARARIAAITSVPTSPVAGSAGPVSGISGRDSTADAAEVPMPEARAPLPSTSVYVAMTAAFANAHLAAAGGWRSRRTNAMLTMPAQISRMPSIACALGSSCRNTTPSTATISGALPRISG